MNKTAIKNFAVWARNKLIADITYKAGLIGVSENGISQPLPQSSKDLQFFDIGTKDYTQVAGAEIGQRNALVRAIQEKESTSDYNTAFKAVIEEVAYTWFNRLIAIRFMEVNDYLPSRIRVLSSENPAKNEPDFVTTPFDTDMEFTMAEQDQIMQLKDENRLDELFRMLFIKQCNKLHEILPELFEETNNYTEMLLSISFTDSDGVVYHLVHDIDEKDFDITTQDEDGKTPGQVEIIGWMYQYYNTELKDETFALLKKNVKITKERIPAATQLFTPDWIVRYMVENSLGRLWIEGHPNDSLKENWKYYLEEAEQEASVQAQLEEIRAEYRNLNPEDIKVIDPCMGSGHILVYCFDVLMQIYESQGYTQRDAARSILENNLYGLDIDKRAAQLAYFAVMMKARQYDRRIFTRDVNPHVYSFIESNGVNVQHIDYFGLHMEPNVQSKARKQLKILLDAFTDSCEYGSILNLENYDWSLLEIYIDDIDNEGQLDLGRIGLEKTQGKIREIVNIVQIITQKYHSVITNPPYMGAGGMSRKLSDYVKFHYPNSKADLFACFIEKCLVMTHKYGYTAMITMESWMFLSSFEKLRKNILDANDVVNMVHMPYLGKGGTSLGINFGTSAFVLKRSKIKNYESQYDYICYYETDDNGVPFMFPTINSRYKSASTENFSKIPGAPVAYWVSKEFLDIFSNKKIASYADVQEGLKTGDNERFIRKWYEIDFETSNMGKNSSPKWFYHTKGGDFRKWYGNQEDVLNYKDGGRELRSFKGASLTGSSNYFKKNITYSRITSAKTSFRYTDAGSIPNMAGLALYPSDENIFFVLGWLNTNIVCEILNFTNPTINFPPGTIAKVPIAVDHPMKERVSEIVKQNIEMSRNDWNSFENSWDFKEHPLVAIARTISCGDGTLENAYNNWDSQCAERFSQLKANEEEINRVFIDGYGLSNELSFEVDDKDITVRKADLSRDIRSLLSYAVGCMFGRYSMDEPGLVYAGGKWDSSKYSTFVPDKDNCIPITDEVYFENDIVGQFVAWMKKVFGKENLEANLDFIAKALGNKGATSREVIRNYFLSDFIKDHIKIYQKRPIYWLFDSGKRNGLKVLVYMHRWNADTVGNLRVEYLHKMQHIYEREIGRMQETIDNSRNSREISKATKRKDKLQKQLKETKDYDAKLAHIALSRIEIDLDDGVKVNYEKVQTARDGKKMQILAKI